MIDSLGDRMKLYENPKAQARFMPGLPIVARMDGRSFSNFTRHMNRPYDLRMINCMVETTMHLVEHTSALIGYTQSDEITLVFYNEDPKSQVWFDGREQKMVSQLAAQATLAFYRSICRYFGHTWADRMPSFDARVFQVPTKEEAANCLVWHEWDATKNSISMAASATFSPKQLHGKSSKDRLDMLIENGINWNNYPSGFKRGTYVKREIVQASIEGLKDLPEKHHARTNPDFQFARSVVKAVEVEPITKIQNRIGWIFNMEDPEYAFEE